MGWWMGKWGDRGMDRVVSRWGRKVMKWRWRQGSMVVECKTEWSGGWVKGGMGGWDRVGRWERWVMELRVRRGRMVVEWWMEVWLWSSG